MRPEIAKIFGADAPRLLRLWYRHAAAGEVGRYLTERLEEGTDEVDAFLGTFVGRAWGIESRLSQKADLHREAYDAIAQLVDPEVVLSMLKAKYGAELDTPEYYLRGDIPHERQTAHQFTSIHAHVRQAPAPQKGAGGGTSS